MKTIVVLILLSALAFVVGSLSSDGLKSAMAPVGLLVLGVSLMCLGRYSWALVFILPSAVSALDISFLKELPIAYITSGGLLVYWLIMYIMGYVKITWHKSTVIDIATLIFSLYFAFTWVMHPVTISAFVNEITDVGYASIGGKDYIWFVFASLTYIFISIIPMEMDRMGKLLKVCFWITVFCLLITTAKGVLLAAKKQADVLVEGEGARDSGFVALGTAIFTYVVCKYDIVRILCSPWKIILIVASTFGVAVPEDVPDDSWEFRNAELINDLKPIEITYLEHTFSLDFTNNGEYVADHFEDIVEFMTLWAYLRQESLIVEVPREVKAEDLSILFELVPKQQQDKATYTVLGDKKPDSSLRPVIKTIDVGDYWPTTPHFLISKYNDMVWKVNEEHLKNCEEYIGRKILPTGRLKVFAKQGYTTAEVWQYRIPLIISLVALIAPTLFSGFTKGETDYLSEISQQLVIIEEKTDANSVHQDILSKIIEIKDELSDISEQLASDDSVEVIANLASQIEELNRLLSEPESPETATE